MGRFFEDHPNISIGIVVFIFVFGEKLIPRLADPVSNLIGNVWNWLLF